MKGLIPGAGAQDELITPEQREKSSQSKTTAVTSKDSGARWKKITFAKDNLSIEKNINYIRKDVGSINSSF